MSTSVEPAASLGVSVGAAGPVEETKARGQWELAFIRFRKDKLAVASLVFIVSLFIVAFIGAPVVSHVVGHGPNDIFGTAVSDTQVPVGPWSHIDSAPYPGAPCPVSVPGGVNPCGASGHYSVDLFVLGADGPLGRDLFLRLLYGAQTSLYVAVLATLGAVMLGVIMGLLAGYLRGWIDTVVSRLIEIIMVFPFLLFIIALRIVAGDTLKNITLGFLPPGVFTLVLIFSAFGWFYPARIMRGVVFSLREKEFIEAARMTGASDLRIMRSHLVPHLVGPIVVYSSLIVATNIIGEAGLSFLGLGIDQPVSSWGNILAAAPDYYVLAPLLMVWPGLAILMTTLAFNLLGDGLRDAIDPRARV